MPALNVTLSLIGWFESASANGHRACIQVRSKQKSQFHNIWHRNLLNITTDVNSIMKVKEYRFHIPIYHNFGELQCAELPECIAVCKLPGLDPISGSAMAAPFIRSSRPVVQARGSKQSRALRKLPNAFRTFTKDHRIWPSRMLSRKQKTRTSP
jgi:hypothetical protein